MQEQKNCLIVGAGDYIGAAIAKRFAAGGFTVCLARRSGDKNAGLVAEIEAVGGKAHSYSLDAREEDQVIAGINAIESEVGALDIVIFNVKLLLHKCLALNVHMIIRHKNTLLML